MPKTFLDVIKHFDESIQKEMLKWASHTGFKGELPQKLAFLGDGFVILGFEHLGLSEGELKTLSLAFVDKGVAVPDTRFKLRHSVQSLFTVVELAEGGEVSLPRHWRQAVLVIDNKSGRLSRIGKRVPHERLGLFDLSRYHDEGDAFVLRRDG